MSIEKITEVKDKIAELEETSRAAAESASVARNKLVDDMAEMVASVIEASGLTWQEVLGIDEPGVKPTRKPGTGRSHKTYVLNSDHDCMYSRGRIPDWMKASMKAAGLSWTSKLHRETFRTQYMHYASSHV